MNSVQTQSVADFVHNIMVLKNFVLEVDGSITTPALRHKAFNQLSVDLGMGDTALAGLI